MIATSCKYRWLREGSTRPRSTGLQWWAHFKCTRPNIELTIHKKEIEEKRDILALGTFSGEFLM